MDQLTQDLETSLQGSTLAQYRSWIMQGAQSSLSNVPAADGVTPTPNEPIPTPTSTIIKPFAAHLTPASFPLQILMRTMGTKNHILRNTLSSLEAQENQQFLLTLLIHNKGNDLVNGVAKTLQTLPQELQDRTQLVQVEGIGRTAPLNVGLGLLEAAYGVMLDDDDWALPNWTDTYIQAAQDPQNHGKLLVTGAYQQHWSEQGDLHATDECFVLFPPRFRYIDQLYANEKPNMTYAFPRAIAHYPTLTFDPSYDVLEDWDFLQKVVNVTGVAVLDNITAIYRFWEKSSNSHALHSQEEWNRTLYRAIANFDKHPLLVPAGQVRTLMQHTCDFSFKLKLEALPLTLQIPGEKTLDAPTYHFDYASLTNSYTFNVDRITSTSFEVHLKKDQQLTLSDGVITLIDSTGDEHPFDVTHLTHNGIKVSETELLLCFDDSIFKIELPKAVTVQRIVFKGSFTRSLNPNHAMHIFNQQGAFAELNRAHEELTTSFSNLEAHAALLQKQLDEKSAHIGELTQELERIKQTKWYRLHHKLFGKK